MPTPHGIPLGTGARPTTGAELAERLLAATTAGLAGLPLTGLESATVVADLDGLDIATLDVDLSGIAIDLPIGAGADDLSADADDDVADETSRERGTLRAATIQAHPALLAGAPVELDVRVAGARIVWIERADGTTELHASDDDLAAMSGEATVSIAPGDLPAVATAVLNTSLAEVGASVSDVVITVTSDGADAASLDATAKARYGVMSAGVRLRAGLRIVDGRVLRLDGLDLSTKNLLASALLGLARGELEKLDGKQFDLIELLPAGVRDPQVHLDVAEGAVTVSASFG